MHDAAIATSTFAILQMIDRRSLYYRPTFFSPAAGKSDDVLCISSAGLPADLPVHGARA